MQVSGGHLLPPVSEQAATIIFAPWAKMQIDSGQRHHLGSVLSYLETKKFYGIIILSKQRLKALPNGEWETYCRLDRTVVSSGVYALLVAGIRSIIVFLCLR